MKSGYGVVVGRPNVGKSTLLNVLVGSKVSIVTQKPQTTRFTLNGIVNLDGGQLVLIDTPGMFQPKTQLDKYMVRSARESIEMVDIILYMVEATDRDISEEDAVIIEVLKAVSIPKMLVVNKVDVLKRKEDFWDAVECYQKHLLFCEVVPISAVMGINIDVLKEKILRYLPEGEPFYPDDILTDKTEREVAAEIVREKLVKLLRQELPYSTAVKIEEFKDRSDNLSYIRAVIYTEKESQKGIIIGKNGEMLKKIGKLARQELEAVFGRKIFLDLWVKVLPNWRNDIQKLKMLGYR